MLEPVCVICGKELYAMTNAVTCGNKACQKQHNRDKMREYQRTHRAKLRAAQFNPGPCDCCNQTSGERRTVEHNDRSSQLCRRCHKAIDAIKWDGVYIRKVNDTFLYHDQKENERKVRNAQGGVVTSPEEKEMILAFWASRRQ